MSFRGVERELLLEKRGRKQKTDDGFVGFLFVLFNDKAVKGFDESVRIVAVSR